MTRVILERGVHADIERITDHLIEHDASSVPARIAEIFDAIDILEAHPLIGRPASAGMRELVIGRDARGYIARYRYDPHDGQVYVLALRAQRESGFQDD